MRKVKAKCTVCGKEVWKLPRHLLTVHKLSREIVKQLTAMRRCTVEVVRLERNSDGDGDNPEQGDARTGGEEIIQAFTAECRFADGSSRTKKNFGQHVSQLRKVWTCMSTNWQLEDWIKPTLFCEKWFQPHRSETSTYQPGTVRSYLGSVKMFVEFASERYGTIDRSAWLCKLGRWNKHLLVDLGKRQFVRRSQDRTVLISPEDVAKICQCSTFRNAKRLLLAASSTGIVEKQVTAKDRSLYLDVLACLVILLITSSGQRPMAILNMTLHELAAASRHADEHMVIAVLNHKTSYKGPAHFPVSVELYAMLLAFIKYIRPPGVPADPVIAFLGSLRSAAPSSYLSKLLNSRYERVIDKKLSCTIFRKTIISRILSVNPEQANVLAHQMSHSERTQKTFYSLPISSGQSAGIARSIQNVFVPRDSRQPPRKSRIAGRSVFSAQQALDMTRVFKPMIDGEMNINLPNLRKCRVKDDVVGEFRSHTEKQLIDKIRSMLRYK